jgi:hypothetical protein
MVGGAGDDDALAGGDFETKGEFVYPESRLAEAVGILAGKLSPARKKMRQGVDWDFVGQHVVYSRIGALGAVRALGLSFSESDLDSFFTQKKPALTVIVGHVSRFFVNRIMMEVTLPSGKVNVKVRLTKNFRLGMEVPIRENNGHFELARRLPRFPGRW